MKFFILTIFCNLLSSGYLQQTNNVGDYNSLQPDAGKSDWPEQTFHTVQGNLYGQAQRSIPEKPCSRRSPSDNEQVSQRINQRISPPPVSKVETLTSAPLMPQTLRYEEFNHKITPNHVPVSKPQLSSDNKLLKTRNSITITNPVLDSTEEIVPPVNNEIQEDNPKPSEQMRSTPTSYSLSSSATSGDKSADSRRDQPKPISALRIASDNEYGAQLENHYNSEPSKFIASEPKGLRSPQIKIPSTDKNEFPGYVANFDSKETHTLPPLLITKFLLKPEEIDLLHSNKCSHDKEPDSLIGHSRRSMSSYNDDNNPKDILSDNRDNLRNNNDPFIESHIENENAMASVLNAEKNTVKTNISQPLKSLDKAKLPTQEKSLSRARPPVNEAGREIIEPTKGAGLMGQSALILMQSEKICYACSTANNPSCWAPDRKTTVKYCRKGNNACITKTFGQGKTFTLIRDCGKSCDDPDSAGIMPKYKSCSICHSELCNGAYSINGKSIIFALILIGLVKYFN